MARLLLVALAKCVLLLVLGAVVGVAAVAVHSWWWGLVLGATGTLIGAWALKPGWSTRLPYAVGWLVPLGLAMVPRAEGDYLVSGDLRGYLLIAVGMVLIVLTTATLPLGRRITPPSDSAEATGPSAPSGSDTGGAH